MKSTLINLIATLVRQLIGSDLWSLIVIAVTQQDGTEKSGSEKREAVITAMRSIAPVDVAGWMLGLAIEVAVARLRTQK